MLEVIERCSVESASVGSLRTVALCVIATVLSALFVLKTVGLPGKTAA